MFTISKEVVPLSDPGGVGQFGDRCMGVLGGRPPSGQRSGTDFLSYSAPEGWDCRHLLPSSWEAHTVAHRAVPVSSTSLGKNTERWAGVEAAFWRS